MTTGTPESEYLYGSDENDTLIGLGGDDTILGYDGDDFIKGNSGRDTVDFRSQDEAGVINLSTKLAVFGAGETDTIRSVENIHGTDFSDLIVSSYKRNVIWGENGDDTIHAGRGDDKLYGGSGEDAIHGGDDDDALIGGKGDDFLTGEDGDDELSGGRGDDGLFGGVGDDKLNGASGADVLNGGDGDDTIRGGGGENSFDGGLGDDTFYFEGVGDYATTGGGFDVLVVGDRGGGAQVGDFELGADVVALDVDDPGGVTLDGLRQSGELKITGGANFTLITFGSSEIYLKGIDVATFSDDSLALV